MLLIAALLVAQAPFLPPTPDWERLGQQSYEYVGGRCENAGDVNGDGRDDMLVLAAGVAAQPGVHGAGLVELFFGSASGYSATADWTVRGNLTNQTIDWAAAGIGDVNDDGYGDLAVSSRRAAGSASPGGVHVFYGGPNGPNGGQDALMDQADWMVLGSVLPPAEYFGAALLGPGDLDGDGIDDLLVGCPNYTNGETYEGAVFLFPGSSGSMTPGPVASYSDAAWSVESNRTHSYLGRSLHAVGDVNGPVGGIARGDFAVHGEGGPQDPVLYGRFWVFTAVTGGTGLDANTASFASFDGGGVTIRKDLAAADFNQDGYSDIVFGLTGIVGGLLEPLQLWFGGPSSFALASWALSSTPWLEGAGVSVAAGDIDFDGIPDLAVVSSLYTGGTGVGRVRVFRGVANPSQPITTTSSWEYALRSAPGGTGNARVEILGDPEGDGTHALAVANWATRIGTMPAAGSVDLFGIGSSGIGGGVSGACPVVHADWSIEEGTWLGLRHEPQLADLNGDGYDDAVVCDRSSPHVRAYLGSPAGLAPNHTLSIHLGDPEISRGLRPVATGDVNGDGYEDVLLLRNGRTYSPSGGGISQYVPAAAYVLMGDATLPNIGWSATENVPDPVHFATAGALADLDGDGFDDVVLGASGHERDPWSFIRPDPYDIPGAVYVYYGSVQGVHGGIPGTVTNASWSATDGNSSGRFGHRVRNAGDLDGDGSDELLVAAPFTRDVSGAYVGAIYLWPGSAAGVNGGTTGSASNALWSRVGTEPGGNLGQLMEAGVDVTGDGIPDLATRRTSGSWMQGIEVWNGISAGYATTPVLVPVQEVFKLLPDFSGDGIGDLCFYNSSVPVRVAGSGRVAVIHGGADLAQGLQRWRAAGEKANVFLGHPTYPVRGDVNGDGLNDLLLTSKWYVQSQSEDLVRTTCYHGTGKALLELSDNPVSRGQRTRVGHLGGDPNRRVFFVFDPDVPDATRSGPLLPPVLAPAYVLASGFGGELRRSLAGRILAEGRTDDSCCWHTDWTVPMALPPGTYDVRTIQLPPAGGELTSETISLVVQ